MSRLITIKNKGFDGQLLYALPISIIHMKDLSMNNCLLSLVLSLTVLATVACDLNIPQDVNEVQCVYEGLLEYVFQPHVDQEDILNVIKTYMQLSRDAFGIHSWPISNEIVVQVTILDIALISLSCQEKLLTNILVQCNQVSGYEEEYYQYEREKILADMLKRIGVEQQLTDGEISHYADLMLEHVGINQLIEICK